MSRRSQFVQALCVQALSVLAITSQRAASQQMPRAALIQTIDSIASAPAKSGAVAGMAVAVVRGRDTLLMKGYGFADLENHVSVTPATVFRIGSVTKQFTSAAIMQLVQQGRLSLDDDITKYLPQVPAHGRTITIRELLNHTSGIPSYTDVEGFSKVAREDLSHDALLAVVRNDSLQFEPGSHFYYNNTGYYILGMLIEKISGKPYGEYLNETLFTPHHLAATTYCDTKRIIPNRAQGYQRGKNGLENADFISMDLPFAAGSLCSTIGDLVAWSVKLNNGGIVTPASFALMTTPVKLTSGRPMPYGFGLSPDTIAGHRVIEHGGGINGFISHVMSLPRDSLTIVVLSNTAPAPSEQVANAIARVVIGAPQPAPAAAKNLPTTAAERAQYVGSYLLTMPDGRQTPAQILEEDGGLVAAILNQKAKLQYQGDHLFVGVGAGRIAFDVSNGRATGFVLNPGSARALEAVRKP